MINIIIPAITLLVYIGIIGFFVFIISRFFYRYWRQKFKFILRYSILRSGFDEVIVKECYDAIDKKWDSIKFKMHLLTAGFTIDEIYEVLYIFEKIKREMGIKDIPIKVKGGLKRK